jgi:acetyl-CoA C-acetyltransferase
MKDVVIVGALRTPIGCFQGALSRHSAVELGSVVVKALVERTGIDPQSVDEVILGQVLTAGPGKIRRVSRRSAAGCRIPFLLLPLTTSAVPD